MDFSTEAAFRAQTEQMLDKVAALGATVVLAQVRPFADALYPSAYFPFSHLCTGQQGQDPGFDPLEIWVTAAHARGLELEAWVNPYRIQQGQTPALCAQSPAVQHPDWVKTTDTGSYLDPANPAVRQYIADALGELCRNYAVDGVHFDDYFYQNAAKGKTYKDWDDKISASKYGKEAGYDISNKSYDDYGVNGLYAWRRNNINNLVSKLYEEIKKRKPYVKWTISPAGAWRNKNKL